MVCVLKLFHNYMEKYKKILKQPVNVLYAFSLIGCMFIATLALTNLLDKKIEEIFSKTDVASYSNLQHAQVGATLTNGLVSHFKLDETSGTTATDSVGTNNGTIVGGNSTWVPGKIGSGSLKLNGTNQYVDVPNFNALNGLNSASISFWVKPSVGSKPFITKWGTGRLFEVGSNGTSLSVIWRIGGSSGGGVAFSQMTPANTLSTGSWNHVVVVYSNPSSTVYVNGNQIGSVSGAGGLLNTSVNDPLRIGWNNIPNFYSGDIDDVRIYNRAVTSQEVSDLYSLSGSAASSVTSSTNTQTINNAVTPVSTAPAVTKPAVISQIVSPVVSQNVSAGCAGASTKCVPEEYPTIQACANVAEAGDTCLVSAGDYSEQVMTKKNGTSDSNRVTFKANGKVVVNGFDIRNSYVTVDGFDITGPSLNQQYIGVTKGGDYCKVLNNTIHDGVKRVAGISFYSSSRDGGITGNYCLFKGNTVSRINANYLTTDGIGSRFENNVFEEAGGWDLVRPFGQDHVFYRNVFRNSIPVSGTGNHPDFVQTFADNGGRSFNMLFEENWIENLLAITETGYQMGQMNSGGSLVNPRLMPDFRDFTFRRNVFANIGNNWNLGVPGITFENNTFYKTAYTQDGLVSGGSLTRGDSSRMTAISNAFIGGGRGGDTQGFYSNSGAGIGQEVMRFYVTNEVAANETSLTPIAAGIMSDLVANGYTDGNGRPTAKTKALSSESDFYVSPSYSAYKSGIYKYLKLTSDLDTSIRNTYVTNYNFVSGPASLGYPPKRADGCVSGVNKNFRFCEKNGVNGGDPMLKNVNDPDGPDNIPFTTDDGLKPLPGSPLCGKGLNGVDIGVYSCDSNKVFATGNSGTGGISVTPPNNNPPTNQPPVVVPTTGTIYVSSSGNDTNTGAQSSPLKTIQKCANIVKAGETCLVTAGVYPEHVETLNSGANGKYVTFKAQGTVTMKGFRIKNPYVRIEGFDITKYDVGLDQGHIAVEPEGDYSQIINNTIRDGIYLSSNNFTFNGANRTITNPSGGFISAGFVPGVTIYIASDINNQILNHDNNGAVPYKFETKKVIAVTDTTLTLDPSNTVFSEGPVTSTIYVNKAEKNGVWGIIFNSSTSRGQPDNCLIQGNTLRNLAGKGMQIAGLNNVIEKNTFERMNGWRMISFFGSNNVFRYNIFRDSTRWPGFQLPKPGTQFALGSGSWDMYDTLMTSTGAIDQQVNDNVFEYNFVKDVDEQLASVEEAASVGTALQNKGLYIRNNVFINVEMSGSFTRPQTILSNNTFYKSARISNQNFVIGKSAHGNPVGSEIKNNAFVDSGVKDEIQNDNGWYSVRGDDGKPTPGVLADYNFVAGSAGLGYPGKTGFKVDNLEANGINGGNPKFTNPANPLGPDGLPFTIDDGLKPLPGSPLCAKGSSGVDIGAYSCDPTKVFATGSGSGVGSNPPPTVPPITPSLNTLYVSNTGSDTNPGTQSSPFKTIQKCANVIKAGETCLITAGVYPEHVQTASVGQSGKYVTFKAQGIVTMKGFRIKNPYVRVEGFDITRYGVGLDQGHITVEPPADNCQIIDNTIRDGIYIYSKNMYFDGPTKTITNPNGGFIAAGFEPGMSIYIGSNINKQIQNHDNNGGVPYKYETKRVISVTDKVLTLDPSNTVFTEGPVAATIYMNRAEKNGLWGIIMLSSGGYQPDNCLIQGNTLSNLAGKGLQIQGSNHIVEKNIWEKMNGWRMIAFYGDNNIFRYNIFRDSPRWEDFELPKIGTVFAMGSGTSDMYDTLMTSIGTPEQSINNTIFEYNFIKDIDEQLASVEEQLTNVPAMENKGLLIRNNIFVNVEMSGSFTRPQTIVTNNTFYKSARISNHNFVIGKSGHGNPVGSVIKNNIFLESGNLTGANSDSDRGWYSIRGGDGLPSPEVTADYNYIAGPAAQGYPAKSTTLLSFGGSEKNGINGGDPKLSNPSNPLGPDGVPFTSDDGLIPLSSSPLCRGGENGTYIGAYGCNGVISNPSVVTPIISSISVSSVNDSSAVISWSTNEVSDTQIEYGLTSAYGNSTSLVSNPVSFHSQTLTNLSPNTTYHFRVKSKNALGGIQLSSDKMFTTTNLVVNQVDVTAPIITTPREVIDVTSGTFSAKLNITTDESAVCKWSSGSGIPYASMPNLFTSSNNSHGANITNLSTGLNFIYIKCIDVKGNANQTDAVVNISVGNQLSVQSDSDSDGVPNDGDKCPNTKDKVAVNKKGCPLPRLTKFHSNDISSLDLNSISDIELRNSQGKVNFNSGNYSLIKSTGESLDIDSNLNISNRLVYLDSSNIPELNKPATITLYNITAAKPKIMRDGVACDKCTIVSYTNNTLVFTVPGFSTYEVIDELAPPVVSNQNQSTVTSSGSSRSGSSRSGGSSSSAPKATFVRSLSITATGDDVRLLQVFLNNQGFAVSTFGAGSRGNESTYFGPATRAALIRFQTAKGIVGTGILDTQTMSIVNSLYSSTGTVSIPSAPVTSSVPSTTIGYTFSRSLTLGSSGSDVRQLQVFLNTKGYTISSSGIGSRGNESIYFGPATKAALIRYQIANGIKPASGFFGPLTRAKVNLQK